MGLQTSKLDEQTLFSNLINFVDENKLSYRANDTSTTSVLLYFDDEILKDSYYLLSKIKEFGGSCTIYHNKSKIFGLNDNITDYSFVSSKISPTTFGWVLNK
jgi:hypothetical protein